MRYDMTGATLRAGDHLKITLTDNGGNKVDLLLNVDSAAATALTGSGSRHSQCDDGDIHYGR